MRQPAESANVEALLGHRSHLRSVVRGLLADEAGVEDVLQDTWLRALETSAPPRTSVRAWLARVARNLALNQRRAAGRRVVREERAATPEQGPSMDEVNARLLLQRRVLDEVLALPESLRGTVHARYFEDLAPAAIARRQGISVHTVNDRLKRGRGILRDKLREDVRGESGLLALALLPIAGLTSQVESALRVQLTTTGAATTTLVLPGGMSMNTIITATAATVLVTLGGLWSAGVFDGQGGSSVETVSPTAHVAQDASAGTSTPGGETGQAGHRTPAGGSEESGTWTVQGIAVRSDGTPAANVALTAFLFVGTDTRSDALLEADLQTDAAGGFAWSPTPPTEHVTVRVRSAADRCYRGDAEELVSAGARPTETLTVHVHAMDSTVEGRVLDPGGAPVEGALVTLNGSVVTDELGHYVLPSSSACPNRMVVALAPGFTFERAGFTHGGVAGNAVVDLQLRPELRVTGRVLDEDGVPLVGARVESFVNGGKAAISDGEGRYELGHFDPSPLSCYLQVSMDGYAAEGEAVSTAPSLAVEHDFVLRRAIRVEGRVLDEEGAPIPSALVGANGNPQRVCTALDGSFVFPNSHPTVSWVEADATGFASVRIAVTPPGDGADLTGVDLVLVRGLHTVAGRVVDSTGQPVAGAWVSASGGDVRGGNARTDSAGAFSLLHVPDGMDTVEVSGSGLLPASAPLEGGSEQDVLLTVHRAGRLAGRVVDEGTGEPITSFRVRFVAAQDEDGARMGGFTPVDRSRDRIFSNAEGVWRIDDLRKPTGEIVGIEVLATGYAPAFQRHAVLAADPDPASLVLRLTAGARLSGQVIDGDTGLPVEGALVRPRPRDLLEDMHGEGLPLDRTDAAGRFRLTDVAGGETLLEIRHADFAEDFIDGPFPVAAGSDHFRLVVLGRSGVIQGTLVDEAGNAVVGVEIACEGIELTHVIGPGFLRTAATDAAGAFRFEGLPDGIYRVDQRLAVDDYDYTVVGSWQRIEDGSTCTARLQPGGSASLSGTLVSATDLPPRVRVSATGPMNGTPSAWIPLFAFETISTDGTFTFPALPPGTYGLEVRYGEGDEAPSPRFNVTGRGHYGQATLTLAEGEAGTVILTLETR